MPVIRRCIPAGFKGSPLRFRLEKWFWAVLTIPVVVADVEFPAQWMKITGTYVAVVSNYALVLTLAGCEQASEAKVAATAQLAQDNPGGNASCS